jgi:hypothetical protein
MRRVSTESVKVLSGKKVYIGIDVHKESWHVTARTVGEEVFNGRIPASYHSLMKLLERFEGCQIKVAYEAGPCGFSLYDILTEDGIGTIVVPLSRAMVYTHYKAVRAKIIPQWEGQGNSPLLPKEVDKNR